MSEAAPVGARDEAYRRLSFWHATVPGDLTPRPALRGEISADVAIVGAGYTGLWTAFYLSSADPSLQIVVVEKEIAGFAASGRNGGWVSAIFPATKELIAAEHGRDAAVAMQRAMFDTVDEVGRVCDSEEIESHFHKGGSLGFALDRPQAARLHRMVEQERAFGFGEQDTTWLDPNKARDRLDVAGSLGAMWTPHCARVHPARLVRGLAEAVERRGVRLFERTTAVSASGGLVQTDRGRVKAGVVVSATEAYGPGLRGPREVAPVYTYMVATEPLPSDFWEAVGWSGRECVWDGRRVYLYAQRTADDRIAIGGGGLRIPFSFETPPSMDKAPQIFRQIGRIIARRWPAAAEARITHTWGGACGASRDWFPSVGLSNGLGWAGGYVGDGVATSNLAGRTLTDLILGRDTDLVGLPWVGRTRRRWEPEPLRWLGMESAVRLSQLADASERRTGRPSRLLGPAAEFLAGW